jgi:hypothetical protein
VTPKTRADSVSSRPLPISIIAVTTIALGIFFLVTYGFSGYLFLNNPGVEAGQAYRDGAFLGWSVSVPVYWSLVFAVPAVLVMDGVFLFRGHNWARMLAVFWWTFSSLSLLYTNGINSMTSTYVAFCLLVIFFLNTRLAVIFFKGNDKQ